MKKRLIKIISLTSAFLLLCSMLPVWATESFDPEAAGLHNIAVGKDVSGGGNMFGDPAKHLVDGKTNTIAATGDAPYVIDVDLAARYPISYVAFHTSFDQGVSGIKITLSNTADFSDPEDIVTVCDVQEEVTPETTYGFTVDGGSYRYLRYEGTKHSYTPLAEVMVYSTAKMRTTPWKVKNTRDVAVSTIANAVLKEVSISVDNYDSENPLTVTAFAFLCNSEGRAEKVAPIKIVTLEAGQTNVPVSVDLTSWGSSAIPEGYTLKAVLLDNLISGHMFCEALEMD